MYGDEYKAVKFNIGYARFKRGQFPPPKKKENNKANMTFKNKNNVYGKYVSAKNL